MAGKTATKPKVKNGIDTGMSSVDRASIDELMERINRVEKSISEVVLTIDDFCLDEIMETQREISMRVEKVESRLGIG